MRLFPIATQSFRFEPNLHQTKFADRSLTTTCVHITTKPRRQKSVTVASFTVAEIPATISSLYISFRSLLPESLQLYIAQVAAHLPSASQLPFNSTATQTFTLLEKFSLTSPEVLTTATFTVILAIVSMASWRSRIPGWGSRYSPAPAPSGPPPRVTDNDFSYLTSDDIVEPPRRRSHDPYAPTFPSHSNGTRPHDPNLGPDIIVLKHRGVTYPLHFPAFSIGDGDLTVGDLRTEGARQTGTDDPRRLKLLYKGRILKDDAKPCKAEGLKQQSELLCVISEPGLSNAAMDDDSDSGADSVSVGPTVEVDGTITAAPKKKRNHRSGKKKGKKGGGGGGGSGSGSASPRAENLAPPSDSASAATSRPTTPAAPKTATEKLDEIASTFHTKLVPQCIQYISNPPVEARTRDLEYKKLSEGILAQVILKLDAVELAEDEVEARQRRRTLVRETQAMLARLDVVHDAGR